MSTTAMNEEALKKDTDCVYFLASPLTCKKGNECEFRHSESARVNPRDCWYWLSGSCLNPHCSFRHPPLETISETDPATGTTAATAAASTIMAKMRVPCFYFLQGYCAKGDKCNFMHGLTPVPTVDVSQKVLKPSSAKAKEPNDNQYSVNKANGSVELKPSSECNETPAQMYSHKAKQSSQDADPKGVDVASRVSEGSDNSASARSLNHNMGVNDRLNHMQAPDSNFLHLQEIQAEDDTLCEVQAADESQHPAHSGEERIQNGTESEELWEESSFDVLVDDGTDQLLYAENMDFISPCDVIVDPLRGHIQAGMMGAEGFADYDYEHVGAYDQYYDSAEYELATYDAYERQLVYEQQLSSYEYNDGIQSVGSFKGRQVKDILPYDRRGMPYDAEAGVAPIDSNDLRNHIVKRRRAERNQKMDDGFHRRQHQGNGFRHIRRRNDGRLNQQEMLDRGHNMQQAGQRVMRHFQGRGDLPKNRQFHGSSGDFMRNKRPYRDISLENEDNNTDHVSNKKSGSIGDHVKGKFKKGHGWSAGGGGHASGNRANSNSQSRKSEVKQDDISFAGPKTLAQIKAEKMRASSDGKSEHLEASSEECTNSNSQVTKPGAPTDGLVSRDSVKSHTNADKISDFEGPKPLSVILRQKRKEDFNVEIQEPQERMPQDERNCGVGNMKDVDSKINSRPGRREMGRYSANEHNNKNPKDGGSYHRDAGVQQIDDSELNRLNNDVDPEFDTDERLDAGDSFMEDVEFVDDDDDDFAKKLGGFLS